MNLSLSLAQAMSLLSMLTVLGLLAAVSSVNTSRRRRNGYKGEVEDMEPIVKTIESSDIPVKRELAMRPQGLMSSEPLLMKDSQVVCRSVLLMA